jgi:hypothetical protein
MHDVSSDGGETVDGMLMRQDALASWLRSQHPEWADSDEVAIAAIAARLGYAEVTVSHWPSKRMLTYTERFPRPVRRTPPSHEAIYRWGDVEAWYASGTRRRRLPGPRMTGLRWVALVSIYDGKVREIPKPDPDPGKFKRCDLLPPLTGNVDRMTLAYLISVGLATRLDDGAFAATGSGVGLVEAEPMWAEWARSSTG